MNSEMVLLGSYMCLLRHFEFPELLPDSYEIIHGLFSLIGNQIEGTYDVFGSTVSFCDGFPKFAKLLPFFPKLVIIAHFIIHLDPNIIFTHTFT